jgi:DNA modification methylase
MIINGNAMSLPLADESVNMCVTSPPYYGLRDFGVGELGLETTINEYVDNITEICQELRRVLRDDGTLWFNIGDSYASGTGRGYTRDFQDGGAITAKEIMRDRPRFNIRDNNLKPKDLIGIPWRVALALQADGWYLRSDIIWHKPNPMPESVRDRPTSAHEHIFLLAKSKKYYYDHEAIKEPSKYPNDNRKSRSKKGQKRMPTESLAGNRPGSATYSMRNKRNVWTMPTSPFKEAHFATFPPKLIEPCILAGCPEGGIVLDPFFGAGTTGVVCRTLNRNFVGIDLNTEYLHMARTRIERAQPRLL